MESTEDIPRKSKKASCKPIKPPIRLVVDFPEVFISKAWLELSGAAPHLYIIFLFKRKIGKMGKKGHQRNVCTNSQELVFTYVEARENLEITERRFHRAIDELIDKGLIDVVKSSSGLFKETTLYGLSDRWRKYGTPQFEKFSRIKRNQTTGFCKPRKKAQIQEEQD